MSTSVADLAAHLFQRIDQVRRQLGEEPEGASEPTARFADLLDSMGMVEFLALLARDCRVAPADIERAAGHQFGTVAEVARRLADAGLVPVAAAGVGTTPAVAPLPPAETTPCWLAGTVVLLPETVQPAAALNRALGRPAGWLEQHAGIRSRRVWAGQDPLAAAADAGRACLGCAGVLAEEVGALLVTSEAPPRLAGLAADLHGRLGLRPETAAVEVGGACTGFLSAVWLARALLARLGVVLVVAVEAPSQFLTAGPGPAGEAAALFGDGAAAALLCADNRGDGVCFTDVSLGADGSAANLLRVERAAGGPVEVRMEGTALAGRAVRAMADLIEDVTRQHGQGPADLRRRWSTAAMAACPPWSPASSDCPPSASGARRPILVTSARRYCRSPGR
jgi:3-oxoacyl-[acyl-carrier-protein] synthase-3